MISRSNKGSLTGDRNCKDGGFAIEAKPMKSRVHLGDVKMMPPRSRKMLRISKSFQLRHLEV